MTAHFKPVMNTKWKVSAPTLKDVNVHLQVVSYDMLPRHLSSCIIGSFLFQHMIIEGLGESANIVPQSEAILQAQKWISVNYKAYHKTKAMFEKVFAIVETEIFIYCF